MSVVNVAVGVVRDKAGRVLIAKRKDGAHQGGLWEFPGGKVEPAESDQQALNRELFEELGIKPKSSSPLIAISHKYPECHVCLHVREVHDYVGEPIGREGQMCSWVRVEELSSYKFPVANKPIISAIVLGRQYAIISGSDAQHVLRNLECAYAQGAQLVQIRAKELKAVDAKELMAMVRARCSELGMGFLINSQMPVKRMLEDGLHLTSSDLMVLKQRPECSGFVAASCHSLLELRKAEQLALDFAVLSPVKQTISHPGAEVLGWQQFSAWVDKVNIPVFALGGLARKDYEKALECGAQGISGISLYKER